MKKTLLLTHEYYPYRGGVARYCYGLFRNFSPDEYVVATDQHYVTPAANLIVTRFVFKWLWPSWLVGIVTVLRLVRGHQIEYIVTPHLLPLGAIAWCVNRLRGIPYAISLHGLDIMQAHKRRPQLTRLILKGASAIIINSQAVKTVVDELGYNRPAQVIRPALDVSLLTVNQHTRTALEARYAGKKIILTVGRLVARKGQDMVIQALPHVIKKVPNVLYLIVGSGPYKPYLESLIKDLGLASACQILTDVGESDLGAYYSITSLFVMPSRREAANIEGFGIVYLEAAYFGLPIIAGRDGGEEEAVGEDARGLCIDGTSLGEVTEAMLALLTDEELAHYLGARARERARGLPTWQTQADLLRRILS